MSGGLCRGLWRGRGRGVGDAQVRYERLKMKFDIVAHSVYLPHP
jgi:hypothetical protein